MNISSYEAHKNVISMIIVGYINLWEQQGRHYNKKLPEYFFQLNDLHNFDGEYIRYLR